MAAFENSMAIPHKNQKFRISVDPAIPFLNMYRKEMKAGAGRGTCALVSLAVSLTAARRWGNAGPSTGEGTNEMWRYISNGISFSLKEEWNSDQRCHMDGP